ncbi:NUMOD4 domain-containing protein [Amycolatopsis sp. NPDC004079]|uniref:NUMOD4 domain-containing protein n=1 Tax=Amycolatopsis sp. NPDC004079 TaxID=3154549 RepID=UPI0033ADF3DD
MDGRDGELVGMAEIAARLDVADKTVASWRSRKKLPGQRDVVGGRPVWSWEEDIAPWAVRTGRLPDPAAAAEEWRPVPGFAGYEASAAGRIRSAGRTIVCSSGRVRMMRPKVLTAAETEAGRLAVRLRTSSGREARREVARLVALAFLDRVGRGQSMNRGRVRIRHLNGDRSDNRAVNLAWALPEPVCAHGHEMTPANTYVTPAGSRVCRRCRTLAVQRLRGKRSGGGRVSGSSSGGCGEDAAVGQLVDMAEIAARLDVAYMTVASWRSRKKLPEQRDVVDGRPVWSWEEDIVPWAVGTGRMEHADR